MLIVTSGIMHLRTVNPKIEVSSPFGILQALWIYSICDFMSYLAFGLYFGCMDFLTFYSCRVNT